ncbi:DUF6286 domain-containing protein [Kitasatospora sp. NPDC051914]|uniref:DUF6286 domain-containing protein n=1 Tax=Kitasatospora sp. NPDC051914 TaxID=3154945 RepID=UPI0034127E41
MNGPPPDRPQDGAPEPGAPGPGAPGPGPSEEPTEPIALQPTEPVDIPPELVASGVVMPELVGLEAEFGHAAAPPGEAGPEEWPPTVPPGHPHRPRAPRTAVTGAVVTCLLVLAGAALYDAVAVATGHAARRWRADFTDELSTRHLDDPWVLGIAAGAVAVGLLLCWLALAPGLRRWLALRRPGAAIDRAGIAALLAARGQEIPGIERCTVRAGRHKAVATVTGSAEPALVDRELREELAKFPLAGPYRLDLRIQPLRPRPPEERRHGHRRLAQEPR